MLASNLGPVSAFVILLLASNVPLIILYKVNNKQVNEEEKLSENN